ncbi:MAG TPA: hypothetical protein VLT16_04765, partial [Candidatus Limnocylindrales bacterium]|nr:hypothetical protein [Candidatus Limnocylindrales bacterium]
MNEKDLKRKELEKSEGDPAGPNGDRGAPDGGSTVKEESPQARERRFRQTDLPPHFIERRKHPRIQTQPPPPPAPPRFEDYGSIIGKPELDEIRFLARHLRGKTVKMVNSTAVGGGVAEILNRLIPLMNELEVLT